MCDALHVLETLFLFMRRRELMMNSITAPSSESLAMASFCAYELKQMFKVEKRKRKADDFMPTTKIANSQEISSE